MRLHFREDVRHDSRVYEVGFDVEVPVAHRPILDAPSCRGDLVSGSGELGRDEGAGPRADAEDEDGGLGWHFRVGISIGTGIEWEGEWEGEWDLEMGI